MPLWTLIGTPQSQGRRSRVGCMGAGSGEGGGGGGGGGRGSFLDWGAQRNGIPALADH